MQTVSDNAYDFVTPNASARPLEVTFTDGGTNVRINTLINPEDLPPTCTGGS